MGTTGNLLSGVRDRTFLIYCGALTSFLCVTRQHTCLPTLWYSCRNYEAVMCDNAKVQSTTEHPKFPSFSWLATASLLLAWRTSAGTACAICCCHLTMSQPARPQQAAFAVALSSMTTWPLMYRYPPEELSRCATAGFLTKRICRERNMPAYRSCTGRCPIDSGT